MKRKHKLLCLPILLLILPLYAQEVSKNQADSALSDLSSPELLCVPQEGCLVWQKPIYTPKPGKGYRLVVENGKADGTNRVSRWRVFIDGNPFCSSQGPRTASEKKAWPIRLQTRNEVRMVLEGSADSTVRFWIEGQAIPETLQTITRPDGSTFSMRGEPLDPPGAILHQATAVHLQSPAADTAPPKIDFVADQQAITISQGVKLSWRVQGRGRTTLYLPDAIEVPATGRAQLFVEWDTTLKLMAEGSSGKVEKTLLIQVAVPEPELSVELTPSSIDLGGEAVLSWKSRHARMVHFLGSSPGTTLPLSGSLMVKGCPDQGTREQCPFILEAVNGKRKVTKIVTLEVIDRVALNREQQERLEREAKEKTMVPRDDQAIRTRWQAFCSAMIKADSEEASSCLFPQRREAFRENFAKIQTRFNNRNWHSLTLYLGRQKEGTAIFVLGPPHARGGEDFHDEDVIYFKQDSQNNWWLYF